MSAPPLSLAERTAQRIRDQLIMGELLPGQRLSETACAEGLEVSRNTLREAFRILTKDGLLHHEANKGISVASPSMASIIDIYRVRRVIEVQAIRGSYAQHPALAAMEAAIAKAHRSAAECDWRGVGSANVDFHSAIVALSDSPRLATFYANLTAELRLAFGVIQDPEFLHAPFIPLNEKLLGLMKAAETEAAALMLEGYLDQSERMLIAAFSRSDAAKAAR
ncbi:MULTISPECIES: GntR family transcriptional regulator [Thioclava]|uniref:GntR family transcriptional regulator n=1 Tax=Thioclava litoralis TaxID=3076557 RepID=A0ABZ1E2W4_9RHOB|nr:GntR family transcriptional regulator [Thioclava sp. FTW29]